MQTKWYIWVAIIALLVIYFVVVSRKIKNDSSGLRRKLWEPYLFILPVLIILIGFFGYPLLDSIMMSFQNYKLSAPGKIGFNGVDNYVKLFSDPDIGLITRNSIVYVVASVGLQFFFGMILALALRKKFRGRNVYQSVVFLPWAFSAFVVGLMFRWSFNGEYGVVNDVLMKLGLIQDKIAWLGTPGLSLLVVIFAMVWIGIPFFAIMILAALQSIPADVYESADIDGAGSIKQFFKITLPYIKPTIIMTLLLRTIWIFNSFDLIVMITGGGPANYSQTLPSYMYSKAFSSYDFGLASALGTVLMTVLIIYALIYLKATQYNKAGDF